MKILLIGDFSSNFDEGFKNIAKNIYISLSKKHEVKKMNVKQFLSIQTFEIIRCYKPDIIHYFTAPTLFAFIILRFLSYRWRKSKIVISALHPRFSTILNHKNLRSLLKLLLRPDMVLYQVNPEVFRDIGKNAILFTNGIDVYKFKPMQIDEKLKLRKKYGIDEKKFIILHVGHLSKVRNLEIFKLIQKMDENYQVLIVGGTYVYKDNELLSKLQKEGCKVIVGYVKNIEEIYALSDCYVFPVPWRNTINIPLTILEAMACNLPVISVKYPTFSIFREGDGLYFVNDAIEIPDKIKELQIALKNGIEIKTREKVLPHSLENITEKLEKIYRELIERAI